MSSFATRLKNLTPTFGLATAGIAAWFMSSFFTPYIASSDHARCLVPANETASIIGWVLAIVGISTALAYHRGSLQANNRQVTLITLAILGVAAGTSIFFVYFQQTNCAGF